MCLSGTSYFLLEKVEHGRNEVDQNWVAIIRIQCLLWLLWLPWFLVIPVSGFLGDDVITQSHRRQSPRPRKDH
jgi:hypothetical protein